MQSILQSQATTPLHVAIVMDGNGRWGTQRGLDRSAGHRAGGEAVERIVEAAPDLGIEVLTLFAFSADNWQRPPGEVGTLMRILRTYVRTETVRCVRNGVRLSIVGRRDRLPARVVRAIEHAERMTRGGARLHLRIALDYSARETIARAARRWARTASPSVESPGRMIAQPELGGAPVPDVDLLIRTGGERRLSDFMLWEAAYAELHFVDRLWPDFGRDDLDAALRWFRSRERRFGRVPSVAAATPRPVPSTSREWVAHFVRNRDALGPIPWDTGSELDGPELVAVAESIRKFQLGEKGEGSSIMRYARAYAERTGDPDYVEAVRLLLAEEHRHSRDLGRFMALHGIPELRRTFTDDVFRRLRNLFGTLEMSIAVLVTAEIIAKAYYPALHDATRSTVLRAICTQTVADERRHVEMQVQYLAQLRTRRNAVGRELTRALHVILFATTMLIVGVWHRSVFRASDWGVRGFLRAAWSEFARDLPGMVPARSRATERRTVDAPARATTIGGRA
jgi:undecaprenyl diphosphate synthase